MDINCEEIEKGIFYAYIAGIIFIIIVVLEEIFS